MSKSPVLESDIAYHIAVCTFHIKRPIVGLTSILHDDTSKEIPKKTQVSYDQLPNSIFPMQFNATGQMNGRKFFP